MKKQLGLATAAATLAAGIAFAPLNGDSAQAATCSTVYWGSLAKTYSPMSTRTVQNLRVGKHTCYDRLVIDLSRGSRNTGYDVRYVSSAVVDPSGQVLRLRGNAVLQVVAKSPAYTNNGTSTFRPANRMEVRNVSGFNNFRQIAYGASFEGQTQFLVGVRSRLPMRVFLLNNTDGGQRLVVDVYNHW